MKIRDLFCALAVLTAVAIPPRVAAQTASDIWLWPLEGLAPGEGILHAPQSRIDGELNLNNLFIGAAEGTPVVTPTDGVVGFFAINYYHSLEYSVSGHPDADKPFDEQYRAFAAELDAKTDPRYVGLCLSLWLADGRSLHLSGLRGDRFFRTGERIRRGERIGTVGYAYRKILEPCISVSVSDRRTRPDDPMTPFGLRTTFVKPGEMPVIDSLSREEAAADFDKMLDILREAYPGIHDAVTPEELDAHRTRTLAALPDRIALKDFYRVLRRTTALVHDSHLTLYPPESMLRVRSIDLPQLYFGWIDSALVVNRTTRDYAAYYGRRIRRVDGIPADSIREIVRRNIVGYDGQGQSLRDYFAALWAATCYFSYVPGASQSRDLTLEFDDGEILRTEGWTFDGRDDRGLAPDWTPFIRKNTYPDANFSLRRIDDSTAYVGLSTFSLSEVEVDSLAAFVRSVEAVPNLIFDVRNNPGGDTKVLARMLSFFADKPFVDTRSYYWMRRPDSIRVFEGCCLNYGPDMEIINGMHPIEGREGYFLEEDDMRVVPDSTTRYDGRLYVLLDEGSCSAATLFPAAILRNHRGLLVGRETTTAYSHMNALKFADILLPASRLSLRVPLARCVFDDTDHPRIPRGRGVLPDHEIRLSLDEIACVRGDSILAYTLSLIDRGVYLGDDPFAVAPRSCCPGWRWAAGATVAVLLVLTVWAVRRKRKNGSAR